MRKLNGSLSGDATPGDVPVKVTFFPFQGAFGNQLGATRRAAKVCWSS